MATDYDITIKRYNGIDYDTLHPTVRASGIEGSVPVSKGGTGAYTAAAARTNLGAASTATYTIAVQKGAWVENSAGGYMKTSTVNGILASDNPIADVVLGSDADANASYLEAWACVTRITTAENSITLYADGDAPASSFTCQIKVVR